MGGATGEAADVEDRSARDRRAEGSFQRPVARGTKRAGTPRSLRGIGARSSEQRHRAGVHSFRAPGLLDGRGCFEVAAVRAPPSVSAGCGRAQGRSRPRREAHCAWTGARTSRISTPCWRVSTLNRIHRPGRPHNHHRPGQTSTASSRALRRTWDSSSQRSHCGPDDSAASTGGPGSSRRVDIQNVIMRAGWTFNAIVGKVRRQRVVGAHRHDALVGRRTEGSGAI